MFESEDCTVEFHVSPSSPESKFPVNPPEIPKVENRCEEKSLE